MSSLAEPAARPTSPLAWLTDTYELLMAAAAAWGRDNAMRLSAAVAMYSILSLSPLLVITIRVTSLVLSEEAASRQVERQVRDFLGPNGAAAVNDMVAAANKSGSGLTATLVSLGVLLFTASGVFAELRSSLNAVWGVDPAYRSGWWGLVRDKLLSFGMVFVVGFLLLVSQFVSTLLTTVGGAVVGGDGWLPVAVDFVGSTLVITLLFAMLFRFLPDARLTWRDVLFGAAVTAGLFKVGQYLQALYFTYGSTASAYGAAGSVVVVLLWVYYSCWILFYGAELIQENARRQGRVIRPAAGGRRRPDDESADHPAAGTGR